MRLHVICLDSPYPDNYGGAIDMYHKLRALHDAGVHVVLHVFLYDGARQQSVLNELAEEVFFYKRITGWTKQFSTIPYVVNSRNAPQLIDNLCRDDAPILFEGIQTCMLLNHPRIASRLKMVRMHNVEHEYFSLMARSAKWGMAKLFYAVEAYRLKRFERILSHADYILPITEADTEYYAKALPGNKVQLLNCFYDDRVSTDADGAMNTQPYVLYHGNLFLRENNAAAHYLMAKVLPMLKSDCRLIIAGRKPPQWLVDEANTKERVMLVPDPSAEEMSRLLRNASVNVLVTFQPTGIKLKLLNSLTHSYGHCVANREMLHSTHLDELCHQADTAAEIAMAIDRHVGTTVTDEEMRNRRNHISRHGYNDANSIVRIIADR